MQGKPGLTEMIVVFSVRFITSHKFVGTDLDRAGSTNGRSEYLGTPSASFCQAGQIGLTWYLIRGPRRSSSLLQEAADGVFH